MIISREAEARVSVQISDIHSLEKKGVACEVNLQYKMCVL